MVAAPLYMCTTTRPEDVVVGLQPLSTCVPPPGQRPHISALADTREQRANIDEILPNMLRDLGVFLPAPPCALPFPFVEEQNQIRQICRG